jgi:hypothetical protein
MKESTDVEVVNRLKKFLKTVAVIALLCGVAIAALAIRPDSVKRLEPGYLLR